MSFMLESAFTFLFLYICIPYSAGLQCTSHNDCNIYHEIYCGVCVEHRYGGGRQCVFPFYLMFIEGKDCILKTDCGHCNNRGKCKNFGKLNTLEIPTCYCDSGFYGDNCEYKTPSSLIGIVHQHIEVDFIGIVKANAVVAQKTHYSCDSAEAAVETYSEIQTSEGYYTTFVVSREKCNVFNPSNPQLCYVTSTQHLKFPFKPVSAEGVLVLGREVLGYLSTVQLRTWMKGINHPVCDRTHNILVSYKNLDLSCTAAIEKLNNCGPSVTTVVEYTRQSLIYISSQVFHVINGSDANIIIENEKCAADVKYTWSTWKINKYKEDLTLGEKIDVKSLSHHPFSLDFGLYKVSLEVTSARRKSLSNFALCYFKVKFEPLVAVIQGASERTISKNSHAVLSCIGSGDPNQSPFNQSHVYGTWSCTCNTTRNIWSKTTPINEEMVIYSKHYRPGLYNITLRIWTTLYINCEECGDVTPAVTYVLLNILESEPSEKENFIEIECLGINCKSTTLSSLPLVLKAKSGHENDIYAWTYFEKGDKEEKNIADISDKGYPNFLLTVKENSFTRGKEYTIVVRIHGTKLVAKYNIKTEVANIKNGTCSVNLVYGVKGVTIFDISCKNFGSGFVYEFYDKSEENTEGSAVFSGRMLGTSTDGELKNFRLTRGSLVVFVIDNNSDYMTKQFNITLEHWEINSGNFLEMYQNLTKIGKEDQSKALRYVSVISDCLHDDLKTTETLEKLLNVVTSVTIRTLSDIKLTVSTLTNVLILLNKPSQLKVGSKLIRGTLRVVHLQTKLFIRIVKKRISDSFTGQFLILSTPLKYVVEIAAVQLNCVHAILSCRDPETDSVNEFEVDTDTMENLMASTDLAEKVINGVEDLMALLQASGQPPIKINTDNNSYIMWVVRNDKDYNLSNYLITDTNVPVKLSKVLIRELQEKAEDDKDLILQITSIEDNIFWWCKSDVKSNYISVSLKKQRKLNTNYQRHQLRFTKINYLFNPVNVETVLTTFVNRTKIVGSVSKVNSNTTDVDLGITVHRLDPSPNSLLSIKFIFPETNGSLLVHVIPNIRPDPRYLNMFRTITAQSPIYSFDNLQQFRPEKEGYVYVGILAGDDVGINQSVSYSFEVNTTLCQHWAKGEWSSKGCKIVDKIDVVVKCQCGHFSIFSAAFPIPPQEINPFADAILFMEIVDNPYVVAFVALPLFLYLLLCLWAWRKDRVDRKMVTVIILQDNFPGDCFPYLLAVYTGSRFNSGTTAHVGIKINGENTEGRAHILSCKDRKVLRKTNDDWFLIFSPHHLGDIKSLHIWHDNTGSSPEWLCNKIVVYDLTKNTQVEFLVEQWLALRSNDYTEALVLPATTQQTKSVKRLFLNNCAFGLRESHNVLSIFLRHPRSEISRLQRVNIFMGSLMATMLCSIMFYAPPDGDNVPDDYEYNVGSRDIYVSIQSLVMSLTITFLLLFAFKRSYRLKKGKFDLSYSFSGKNSARKPNRKQPSVYSNFVRIATKLLKTKPLTPVQLSSSESSVVVRKKWLVFAWVSCFIVIITCSWCTMLFGLKMGKAKSLGWMTSVFFTITEDMFVTGPAKIVFFAVVLAIALQKNREEGTHRVFLGKAETLNILPSDENYLEKILVKRNHPTYVPLQSNVKEEMLKKKQLINNWWTLVDFSMTVCFVFVLSTATFRLWSSNYYTNSRIKNFMTEMHHPHLGGCDFFSFRHIEDIKHYLHQPFFRAIYKTFWYNGYRLNDADKKTYWTEDFTHTQVGLQKLRQLRVKPRDCKFKHYINTTKSCIQRWSIDNEDTDTYGPLWEESGLLDLNHLDSAWWYSENKNYSSIFFSRLIGRSGILYEKGGYTTLLGPTKTESLKEITELNDQNWQNQLTSVVFIEFTLYTPNLDLFSQVTITVEYLIAGTIGLKVQVSSTERKLTVEFWNALFVALLVYYILRAVFTINRLGLIEYLKTSRNRSRLIILFLGISCIALAITHYVTSTTCLEEFVHHGIETYFDFDKFISNFLWLQNLLSILLAIAMFRAMLIFRGGRSLLNHVYTLIISANTLFWLTLVTITFLMVEIHFSIWLNIFSVPSVKDVIWSLKSKNYLENELLEHKAKVFFTVKLAILATSFACFVIVFMHFSKIAKTYNLRKDDKLNLVKFLIKRFKKLFYAMKKERRFAKLDSV